ncbi:MerR family transcriptional regulator [Microbacterium sp. RD1]|uniref:MerR family transcriptional regulator n=1 Tax=Microbacterium sp. RD1 TaxID=3457313 RepID=UPI003FA5AD77
MLISEAAELSDVSTRMLRYYENQGLVVPGRDVNGYRTYCDEGIYRARQVRALLAAGVPARAIVDILPTAALDAVLPAPTDPRVRQALRTHADALATRASEMMLRSRALTAYLERTHAEELRELPRGA